MSWDDYAEIVTAEWHKLLNDPAVGEPEIHDFLEQHPCLVPGYDAFDGAGYGNLPAGPGHCCLYSKPPLPYGTAKRIPDFMWVTTDSRTQWAVLIEIEDPKKPWLTKSGQQTAKFTQAEAQVVEWKSLLSDPENKKRFMEMYGLPGYYPLEFVFCLVYGRRDTVLSLDSIRRRHGMMRSEIHTRTFDRLRPAEPTRDYICIRYLGGKLKAVSIPPTLKLNLGLVWRWQDVADKSKATLSSLHFDPVRQKFLAERFDYWDNLAPTGLDKFGLPEGE
jgi:hypothetical protein